MVDDNGRVRNKSNIGLSTINYKMTFAHVNMVLTGAFGGTIKSSTDFFQFDNDDIKVLSNDTRQKLR